MTEVKLTSNGVEVVITGVTPPLFCTGGGGGTENKEGRK